MDIPRLARNLTRRQCAAILTARTADRVPAWWMAYRAAQQAARDSGRVTLQDEAAQAAWDAAPDGVAEAARDAALAMVVRDHITREQFDLLTEPFLAGLR